MFSKQDTAEPAVDDELELTERELERLAKLLDVLMEADFYIKRKQKEAAND